MASSINFKVKWKLLSIELQGTATKKSDAFSLIYLHYLQHYKGATNVFGSTLALVGYFF